MTTTTKVFVLAGGAIALAITLAKLHKPTTSVIVSLILDHTRTLDNKPEQLRTAFRTIPLPLFAVDGTHSHGTSARDRNAAVSFIDSFCLYTGRLNHVVQLKRADERRQRDGTMIYRDTKDTMSSVSLRKPSPLDVISMVDVDQYIDMDVFLASNHNPVLLYTFQPSMCAKDAGDYSFSFDEQSIVHYCVNGGGQYRHPVWNYSLDTFTAYEYTFGIPTGCVSYLVERRTPTPDHELVLLIPFSAWKLTAFLHRLFIKSDRLTKLKLFDRTHNRLIHRSDKTYVSTAVPGQLACAYVEKTVDESIRNFFQVASSRVTRAAIESHLPLPKTAEERSKAFETSTILLAYHSTPSNFKPPMMFPVNVGVPVRSYQLQNFDPDAKVPLRAFMQPIIDGAFVPARTKGNEEISIDKRIVKVRNSATVSPFIQECIKDFCEHFLPTPHLLVPVDIEEVYERQKRPSQRALLDQAEAHVNPKAKIVSFQKGEAYPDVKDPRNISTFNTQDKRDYSTFTYAISDYFKENVPSYGFSKNPKDIACYVSNMCANADHVIISDFSRFDGTIGLPQRLLERTFALRAFAQGYHDKLDHLMARQFNLFGICTFGTKYEQGLGRGSGSPETSLFNTISNMFTTYVAHRMTLQPTGGFVDSLTAWEMTQRGTFGGDDGLAPNVDLQSYEKAARTLGLNVKANVIKRGEAGVTYLSRIYAPDVWYGNTSNMADLRRQLPKFYLTTQDPNSVSLEQILVNKAAGFALSDPNTPILGPFCTTVMKLSSLTPDREHMTYLSTYSEPVFSNEYGTWMDDVLSSMYPEFDTFGFYEWLLAQTDVLELLSPPQCHPAILPTPHSSVAFVDGEVLLPATQPTAASTNTRPKRRLRGTNSTEKPVPTRNTRGHTKKSRRGGAKPPE